MLSVQGIKNINEMNCLNLLHAAQFCMRFCHLWISNKCFPINHQWVKLFGSGFGPTFFVGPDADVNVYKWSRQKIKVVSSRERV